ncbi:MAG: helicase-exonuclease AddAB subunit AddB [Lachnospiraceae bacterium]|nr:helicase-exonuclease AddAB subunit AddB [Lachnospiraceae bacterium]
MALTLVTGGAGSGKTEYIYKKIIDWSMKEPERQFFVIVPEQATMQAQKDIVRLHPRHGTMNIDIVSFQRLAYRIFSELSFEQPEVLDDTGKTMVLRKLAGEKRKELAVFSSHLNQAGFIDEVKSMLSEFYQYGVTPELLKEQMEKDGVSKILMRKLEDMNVIYQAFREFTKERYITMEELLDVLCSVVGKSELLKDSVLVLDGYTGFTPVQYRLIGLLFHICKDIYVTVTATEGALYGPDNEADLFDMSRKMAGKLKALAVENGTEVCEDLLLCERPLPRFLRSPSLDYLERTMFRYPYHPYEGDSEGIRLVQAENPADEVDFVVNRIHQLVKRENYRYREIAVICGDLPGYAREITHQFEENGIPFFLDEKRDVSGNPFIRLMKAALEIIQRGFDYESMFQYLRTGLVSEETERIDRLETYVRAMGIRGLAKWEEPWERTFEGGGRLNLKELNEFKEEILAPLAAFKEKAGERGVSVAVMTEALTELLMALGVEKKLADQAEWFWTSGMEKEAREYEEIYGLVMELFERLCDLLGDEVVSKREYLEILNAGFLELKVGMIPAGADRVVAGDLKRTRLSGIRALFFVGVNEGVVPADTGNGGILTEQERETLKKNSLELAPTAREEGFMQRFYLYLALTKPSELLTLSWTALSSEGKTMRPSGMVIGQMRKRFPDLSVQTAAEEKEGTVSLQAAGKAVIAWLQDPENMERNPKFGALYRYLAREGNMAGEMERLAEACAYSYEESGIGREAAKELYGAILNGSVTRMEGYAACAYAHFLSHGLELKKRREYELDLSDMGNLFHRSIDLFFSEVRTRGMDFREIGEKERRALVKTIVDRVSKEYRNTIMKSSARNSYLEKKVERITDRTIRALIYQIQKGDFEPEEFEVDVTTRIPLRGGESLNLRGRIDRMDVFEDEDHVYVKIMDYKSGSTSFDLALLYHGLQLQLVVYMDAALKLESRRKPGKEAVPAGIFYYHIDDPVLERPDDESAEAVEAGILKKLRMNGLVNSSLDVISHMDREIVKESDVIPVALKDGLIQESKSSVAGGDRFKHLSGFVNRSLKTMGEEILDGNTAVNPYKQGNRTACDYCPYHSICGFDLKTSGFGFRKFKSMKADAIWEEIEKEGGAADGEHDVDNGTTKGH